MLSTTPKTATPRITTISAHTSSPLISGADGVQIEREVVVTSQKHPIRKSTSTPHMTEVFAHERSQSHDLLSSSAASRTKSTPKILGESTDRHSSPDLDQYDSAYPDPGRESMKALSEFLMTNTPPPNNWVSIPSDDEMSLKTIKRYKLFGMEHKKRRRVHKPQVSIQLPPTAVSARTRSGSRHIAISIPWEHDYQEYLKPAQAVPRPHTAPRLYTSDKGTVTVLKPVVEARESIISQPVANPSNIGGRSRANTPPSVVLGPEATRTLEKYYQQLHRQQQPVRSDSRTMISQAKQAHIASTMDTSKVDQRGSAGTMYSATTYSTAPGHSRGASSISTVQSGGYLASARIDGAPPRRSSKGKSTAAEEAFTTNASRGGTLETAYEEPQNHPLKSLSGSFNSGTSSSQSHPRVLIVATADLARGYRSPGPQYLSRTTTPIATDPPSKKLPDLPTGAAVHRPASAPTSRSNSTATANQKRESPVKQANSNAQQSRLDRVKARKMRDLAAVRTSAAGGYFPPVTEPESRPQTPDVAALIPPPDVQQLMSSPQADGNEFPSNLAYKKSLNTITPIMIVISLPPYTGIVLPSDLPSPRLEHYQKKSFSGTSANTITSIIHTPPRSVHEDYEQSDSDTIPTRSHSTSRNFMSRDKGPAASGVSSKRSSIASIALETRRQQRRSKRNMTLHERDLDQRVERLERDNALLVSTLKVIAGSFGVLNRMFPENDDVLAAVGKARPSQSSRTDSKGEDAGVETLIRDLQRKTNRYSGGVYGNVISRVEESGRVRLEEPESSTQLN